MSAAIEGEIVTHSQGVKVTKHDEQTVTYLEAAFHNGFNITEACQYADIARKTFYEWLADDDIFSYRMSVAQSAPLKKAKEVVLAAIQAGDPNIALRYLTLRDPDFKPKILQETDPDIKEARHNFNEVLDAIAKYDPSGEPVTSDGGSSSPVVAPDPTDIQA